MASVPAGWYPDPAEPTRLRWFGDQGWTDHVRTLPTEDEPPAAEPEPPAPYVPATKGPTTILPNGGARRRFARH